MHTTRIDCTKTAELTEPVSILACKTLFTDIYSWYSIISLLVYIYMCVFDGLFWSVLWHRETELLDLLGSGDLPDSQAALGLQVSCIFDISENILMSVLHFVAYSVFIFFTSHSLAIFTSPWR